MRKKIDRLEDEKALLEKIADNPMVLQVGLLPSGICAVFAEYIGSQGLSDLGRVRLLIQRCEKKERVGLRPTNLTIIFRKHYYIDMVCVGTQLHVLF